MRYNLVFLFMIFLIVIFLSILYINTYTENFSSSDPVVKAINNLKKKYLELQLAANKSKKTIISTPDGNTPVATLISTEYQHLTTLAKTYKSLSGSSDSSTIDTMNKSLTHAVTTYNYINTYLKLNMPSLENNIIDTSTNSERSSVTYKAHNINKNKRLSGKSISLKSNGIKKHHSIQKLAEKNNMLKKFIKGYSRKSRSRNKRSGRKGSGRKGSGRKGSGRKRSGRKRSGRKGSGRKRSGRKGSGRKGSGRKGSGRKRSGNKGRG